MLDARPADPVDQSDQRVAPLLPQSEIATGRKKPVCIVLHQENSNPGHVGQWFARNGHALDIRKPRYGEPLPETLEHHCGAVIFGGPMSANDKDEFVRRGDGVDRRGAGGEEAVPRHLPRRADAHQPARRPGRLPPRGDGRDRLLSASSPRRRAPALGHFPTTSTSGIGKGASCRTARGCLPHPPAHSLPRPSPTARPSACSSIPRSRTRRCIAGPATISGAST